MNLARQAHQEERAAIFEAGAAVREAFFGNVREARQRSRSALELSRSRDVEYGAAFALAVARDDAGSQALAADLEKRFPEDTLVRFTYLPVCRTLLALNRGDSSSALEHLEAAAPYDLAITGAWFGSFGNLYAPYVRGQAFLAAHRFPEAIAEFQKILDHPRIVFVNPRTRGSAPATRPCLRVIGKQGRGEGRLRGLPDAMEKCRTGHTAAHASQSGIQQTLNNTTTLGPTATHGFRLAL
jgi:hypothetical protein